MNEEDRQKFNEMYDFIQSLKNATTIPFDVDGAFRDRLSDSLDLMVSTKGANSEDQAVDEGGSATYDVLGDPAGFLEINIAGTVYYLPYYNA